MKTIIEITVGSFSSSEECMRLPCEDSHESILQEAPRIYEEPIHHNNFDSHTFHDHNTFNDSYDNSSSCDSSSCDCGSCD